MFPSHLLYNKKERTAAVVCCRKNYPNFGRKSQFWSAIKKLSKIDILVKN